MTRSFLLVALGLASWTVTQRIKEVGIPKVLGATSAAIVKLLTREWGSAPR